LVVASQQEMSNKITQLQDELIKHRSKENEIDILGLSLIAEEAGKLEETTQSRHEARQEIKQIKKDLDASKEQIKQVTSCLKQNANTQDKADWTEGCDDTAFHASDAPKMNRFGPNTWLGNTGASSHYVDSDTGMFDVLVINEPIKVGNGSCMTATKIGKLRRTIIQRDGTTSDIVLHDVKYVPQLWVNLFSIGKALAGGFEIGNKGMLLYLKKGTFKMTFDCLMTTKKGYVMGIDTVPVATSIATAALERDGRININILHKMLSHVGKDATIKTAA
jgi:hypothetical protein